MDDTRHDPPPSRATSAGSLRTPVLTGLVVALVLALALAVAVIVGRGFLANLFDPPLGVETIDRSQPAVLEAVRDMAELRAASGQYNVLIDVEEDVRFVPSAIAGERTLFVAMGTVDAGVDLADLDPDAIEVSADGTSVSITLPPAVLTAPRIDPDASYVYDRERGLLNRLGQALGDDLSDDQELYQQATAMLAEAAADSDLQERAESNTADVLDTLLGSLGYDDVDITFDGEQPGTRTP